MIVLAASLLATALVRLSIWDRERSRVYTILLFTLVGGHTFQLEAVRNMFDSRLLPHLADLISALLILATCYLLGLIGIRDYTNPLWRRAWLVFVAVGMAVTVVSLRFGHEPFSEDATGAYLASSAVVVAAGASMFATTIREVRQQPLLTVVVTAIALILCGTLPTLLVAALLEESVSQAAYMVLTVTVHLGLVAVGLAGVVRVCFPRVAHG